MQFMADILLPCEECNGKRYKKQTLDITFSDNNIADVLEMTIDEAIDFFIENKQDKIVEKLLPLQPGWTWLYSTRPIVQYP